MAGQEVSIRITASLKVAVLEDGVDFRAYFPWRSLFSEIKDAYQPTLVADMTIFPAVTWGRLQQIAESSSSNQLLSNPLYASSTTFPNDNVTFQSDETGLYGRSDEEKRLIRITTISVVTRLALEFHTVGQEEVTKLTISMLLQRLRTLEPTLEAAIANKPCGSCARSS
ncbi:uncharacterized protein BJ212DRAFT_1486197 [Suillus subaureus]|uniref:Uncharacterized protein n=1 Tax=Suillus subaureus TaxID=48587 RepID=A0A9P7J710_9AGAM|nr:uncharacterized protein BJ212DRAFT_1486197 [Suillus subaureus]KAG1805858.1 hypothetical protein BJ212DRAFT_1486197 [Suillus subaureus]